MVRSFIYNQDQLIFRKKNLCDMLVPMPHFTQNYIYPLICSSSTSSLKSLPDSSTCRGMLRLLDLLLLLDHLKNAKASIPNDFSWYKRSVLRASQDLAIFIHGAFIRFFPFEQMSMINIVLWNVFYGRSFHLVASCSEGEGSLYYCEIVYIVSPDGMDPELTV